jgi:DNA polymerase-3 subunit delta'
MTQDSEMAGTKDDGIDMLPWLNAHCEHLRAMMRRGHAPQALLIHGPPGTGRRHLGLWLASELLGVPFGRLARVVQTIADEEAPPDSAHPDLLVIRPLPEKDSVSIEQVRDLTGFLQLKSHQGGERVALVWPAESMTHAAANSLLKTLEEPPPSSTVILIATAPGGLPPTILSRCHRLWIGPPSRAIALAWLTARAPAANWELLLDFAGGAPLEALALHRRGAEAQMENYARDLHQLRQGRDTPVAVARRWTSVDPQLPLRWLYWDTARSVVEAATGGPAVSSRAPKKGPLQNPLKHLTIRQLQERVRDVEELYRNRTKAMNTELQLTSVLQRWYGDTAGGDKT